MINVREDRQEQEAPASLSLVSIFQNGYDGILSHTYQPQ